MDEFGLPIINSDALVLTAETSKYLKDITMDESELKELRALTKL